MASSPCGYRGLHHIHESEPVETPADRISWAGRPTEAQAAPLAPTSPRVRGEVDLRAEPLRSEASRVRGPARDSERVEAPPHPDSFAPLRFAWNPTSPRTRGEVEPAAHESPHIAAKPTRLTLRHLLPPLPACGARSTSVTQGRQSCERRCR